MRRHLITVALIALAVSGARAGKLEDAVEKGNKDFTAGKYKEALEQYQIAETERPESPELDYNIANALHEEGQYEEAVDRYTKALNSDDVNVTADAYYNLGNTQFRMGDYQKAIEAYQQSLQLRPGDMNAKYNLELSRRLLKDQMQSQQQDQNQQNQQQQKQDQQQQQQQDQQDQENQQQNQEQQQAQQADENKDQKEPQDQQSQQQVEEKPMSKEDAERILNALADDEKDVQKQIKRKVVGGDYVGKDW